MLLRGDYMSEATLSVESVQETTKRNDILKLIAIVTMIIDHIGYMFFPGQMLYRTIGRIAFPIFAYQVAIGYKKTSSVKNYSKRMLSFALVSYLPYIYFSPEMKPNPFALNVMFLLLAGIGMLKIFSTANESFVVGLKEKDYIKLSFGLLFYLLTIVIILAPDALAIMLTGLKLNIFGYEILIESFRFSYGSYGLLLILLFYLFEEKVIQIVLGYVVISLFTTYLTGGKYLVSNISDSIARYVKYFEVLFQQKDQIIGNITGYKDGFKTLDGYFFQARSLLALPFIFILSKLDFHYKLNKYVSYWFYPVHMSLFIIIKLIIIK